MRGRLANGLPSGCGQYAKAIFMIMAALRGEFFLPILIAPTPFIFCAGSHKKSDQIILLILLSAGKFCEFRRTGTTRGQAILSLTFKL
jgi:hypothetical protein